MGKISNKCWNGIMLKSYDIEARWRNLKMAKKCEKENTESFKNTENIRCTRKDTKVQSWMPANNNAKSQESRRKFPGAFG